MNGYFLNFSNIFIEKVNNNKLQVKFKDQVQPLKDLQVQVLNFKPLKKTITL
jgi:hypothetical protein